MDVVQPTSQVIDKAPMNQNEEVTDSSTGKVIQDERLSWDDLDRVESNAEKEKAAEKKQSKKEEKYSKNSEQSSGSKNDKKQAVTDETLEAQEKTVNKDEESPENLEISKAVFSKKGMRVSLGKEKGTVDIPFDTVVPVKADGEIKEMPLREALNLKSGEITVETRLNEVSEMDKGIRAAGQRLQQYAVETVETTKADPIAGLEMIAQIAGDKNPQEFAGAFFNKLVEMASQVTGMSEAERRAYMAEMKLNSREQRDKLSQERQLRQSELQRQQEQTKGVMKKYGMTEQDWFDAKEELKNSGVPEDQITSEAIVRQNAEFNVYNIIKEAVPDLFQKKSDPKIGNILQESFEDLTELYVLGDTDKDGLIELVRDTLSPFLEDKPEQKVDENVRKLNEKLNQDGQARIAKSDNSDPTKVRSEKTHEILDSIWAL